MLELMGFVVDLYDCKHCLFKKKKKKKRGVYDYCRAVEGREEGLLLAYTGLLKNCSRNVAEVYIGRL